MIVVNVIVGICIKHWRVITIQVEKMENGFLRSYTNEKGYCDLCNRRNDDQPIKD